MPLNCWICFKRLNWYSCREVDSFILCPNICDLFIFELLRFWFNGNLLRKIQWFTNVSPKRTWQRGFWLQCDTPALAYWRTWKVWDSLVRSNSRSLAAILAVTPPPSIVRCYFVLPLDSGRMELLFLYHHWLTFRNF